MGDIVAFDAFKARPGGGGQTPEAIALRRVFAPRPRQGQVDTPFLALQADKVAKQLFIFIESHSAGRHAKQAARPTEAAYSTAIRRLETLAGMMQALQDRAMAMEGREVLQEHIWKTCGVVDDALQDLRRQKDDPKPFSPGILASALAAVRADLSVFLPERRSGAER